MRFILIVLVSLFTTQVFAENIYNRSITRVAVYNTYAVVAFTPKSSNEAGCSSRSASSTARIDLTNEGGRYLLSMAQALYISKSNKVSFGLSSKCVNSLNQLYRVEGK